MGLLLRNVCSIGNHECSEPWFRVSVLLYPRGSGDFRQLFRSCALVLRGLYMREQLAHRDRVVDQGPALRCSVLFLVYIAAPCASNCFFGRASSPVH